MEAVRLHFPGPGVQPLRLMPGIHDIGWCGEVPGPVPEPAQAILRLSVDQRGIWMLVLRETARIHLNGRRVHRMALLRCGDVVHVDMHALQLMAPSPPPVPGMVQNHDEGTPDPRLVLRAHGGYHHGCCFNLDHPLLVGSSTRADIQLDGPDIERQHARLQRVCGQVRIEVLAAADCVVNGHHCRTAVLQAGDQVVFGHQRFVLEAPQQAAGAGDAPTALPPAPAFPARTASRPLWPLTWLLLAALALAALLAGLLLFGEA